MQSTDLPLWLDDNDIAEPIAKAQDSSMQYSIALPQGWNKNEPVSAAGAFPEHVFTGVAETDWLVISYMDKAVAGHNMENWVNLILSTAGFPCMQMSVLNPAPVLVTWKKQPVYNLLLQKHQCDEMLAYAGSALVGENKQSRLFMLLLRRQNFAWKIFLSINSDWGNTDYEADCLLKDHLAASNIFGSLILG